MSADLCPFSRQPCMKADCHMWMWLETVNEATGEKQRNEVCSINVQSFMLNDVVNTLKRNTTYAQQTADAEQRRAAVAEFIGAQAQRRLTS